MVPKEIGIRKSEFVAQTQFLFVSDLTFYWTLGAKRFIVLLKIMKLI